jgi:predicted  nucleic acid-binding Zn-ribbon protein
MTSGNFTVSEVRLVELEEMNNALQDEVYILKRDLRQANDKIQELTRERDNARSLLAQLSEATEART